MICLHGSPHGGHGEQRALAAKNGHVAAPEKVVQIEARELEALRPHEEAATGALDCGLVEPVDRRDSADSGILDHFRHQVLHAFLVENRVAVNAQDVVIALGHAPPEVERADLLVLVRAHVDHDYLAREAVFAVLEFVDTGKRVCHVEGLVCAVVDHDEYSIRRPGLGEKRLDCRLDRVFLVVGGDDGRHG